MVSNPRSKVVIHYLIEASAKEVADYHTYFLRYETSFFRSDEFGFALFPDGPFAERKVDNLNLGSLLVALDNVSATGCERAHDGCVGRRTAYAQFFEFLYKGTFRIAGRRLGEFALGKKFETAHAVPLLECGELAVFLLVIPVKGCESVKQNRA